MDARSALFDLYGDHLRLRPDDDRGQAPVAALVRLLAPLGVQPPAVRTAVSRMQGWLAAVRLPAGPGYALTPRAWRRLDEAAARIYRTSAQPWESHWHVLVVNGPRGRSERERLHAQLGYLGYGPLGSGTWVSPRRAPELAGALADAGADVTAFSGQPDGDPRALMARAWDLDALALAYRRFYEQARRDLRVHDVRSDEGVFAARSRLVHHWRTFLFLDPGLPPQLLPADWPGTAAALWFDQQAALLLPAARRFLEACLSPTVPALHAAPERLTT